MEDNKCGFCHTGDETTSICGSLHKDTIEGKAIAAHHKCMQYSATLVQYKSSAFGGFKKHQVLNEIRRGSRLVCSLCKTDKTKKNKKGATSGCALKHCRKTFHYYCVSMNKFAVAKRYRVAAGQKVVILYRVFCSKKHEELYRKNLKAEDVVGGHEGSSESEAEGSSTEDYESDDSDREPARKRQKAQSDTDFGKFVETDEDVEADDLSSPPMTAQEVIQETQKEFKTLLKQRSKAKKALSENAENGGSVGLESVLPDDNLLSTYLDPDLAQNAEGPETSKGFYIVIPGKFDVADLKSICNQAEYPMEKSVVWPACSDRKELQEKHLPFIMWDITSKLREKDSRGLNQIFTEPSASQYECLYEFHMQNSTSEKDIYKRLFRMISDVNCLYTKEVCRLVLHEAEDNDRLHVLILSLPVWFTTRIKLSLYHHLYQWSPNTVASFISDKPSRVTCEQEKRIMFKMLRQRLRGREFELSVLPQDPVLAYSHSQSVVSQIEFKIETLAQGDGPMTKVIVIHSVDRAIVQYKPYIQKLLLSLMNERSEHEMYCLISILPSDEFRTIGDVLTEYLNDGTVVVYSAFDPSIKPITCLLLYSPTENAETKGMQNGTESREPTQFDSQWSVYMDKDDGQASGWLL